MQKDRFTDCIEEKEIGSELAVGVSFDERERKSGGAVDGYLELQDDEVVLVLTVFALVRLFQGYLSICMPGLKLVWLLYGRLSALFSMNSRHNI